MRTSGKLVFLASLGFALVAPASAQQILETYNASLTTFLPGTSTATKVQGIRPHVLQRGVNLDGSLKSAPPFAMALAGNPFENAWVGKERQGDLRLDLGAYSPLDIDIALPAKGIVWPIGRSYNSRQVDASGTALTSNGYQGKNWQQTSQPEILLYLGLTTHSDDVLYLVYRADAYVEFRSTNTSGTRFKGKNGAAGVFEKVSGSPDTFIYHAQNGTAFTFLGFNTTGNNYNGVLWKVADEEGNTAYVGSSSSASAAISANGWDGSGRILLAFDPAGRRFTYSYTTLDSVMRLTQVKAELNVSGTWTEVARVDYDYYQGNAVNGDNGDLRKVTVTTPLSDSGVSQEKKKSYRYWEGTSDDVSSYDPNANPPRLGYVHQLMLVLDFEGARRYDLDQDSTFNEDYTSATTAALEPYAAAYLEYSSARQVNRAFFNGVCGCTGGASGVHSYIYSAISYTNNAGYDPVVSSRTVVNRPDGSYLTQYFDEVGQGMTQLLTDVDPASGGTVKKWATWPDRDTTGCVKYLHMPDNLNAYTHSTGAITGLTSAGVIHYFERTASGNATGFQSIRKVKQGTSVADASATYVGKVAWNITLLTKQYTDVAATVVRPLVSATRVYPTAGTSDTGYLETAYAYTAYSPAGTLVYEKVTKTDPVVTTGNNGSGTATTSSTHYLKSGRADFEKDEQARITYHAYTDGQETIRIEDANTSGLNPPTGQGFDSSGTPLNRKTTTAFDAQGRVSSQTLYASDAIPLTPQTYRSKLADERVIVLHFTDHTTKYFGPVRFEVLNQAGKSEVSGVISLTSNETTSAPAAFVDEAASDPILAVTVGSVAEMQTTVLDAAGVLATESRGYFLMPVSGVGSEGPAGNYDSTRYGYDGMGRRWRTKEASGTIRRTVFDTLGRQTESWIGTNDHSFAGGEAGVDNMFKTDVREYDLGLDKGKSLLTKLTQRVDSTSGHDRITTFNHDYRGRQICALPPTAPYSVQKYDNLSRVVATGQYSSSSGLVATSDPIALATNRMALSESVFDEMGRVWKSIRHKVTQTNGADADNLTSLSWFDERGRTIKVRGEEYRKTIYDRLGRVTDEYALAKDNDTLYADASTVAGDIVLEEYQSRYVGTKPDVLLSVTLQRKQSDISAGETAGPLDTGLDNLPLTVTAANLKGRAQISASWYDSFGRVTDTVQFGTYGGADFNRLDAGFTTAPARMDLALRTSTVFNTDGTVQTVEDPRGLKTLFVYDALGRRTREVKNWNGNGEPVPSGTDVNVTVAYGYTNGLRTSLTALMPAGGGGNQVTTYTFGTTQGTNPGDSKIASGSLLQLVTYPDSGGPTDVVTFAYNAQGNEIYKKDQAGTVIETDFDLSGRATQRRTTASGPGIDTAILRIATAYDSLGRTSTVDQFDNALVGSGTAQDGVKFVYDDWGNVASYIEDKDSAVSGGGVQYTTSYTWLKNAPAAGRYTIRKTAMTMPDGRVISYQYRFAGGLHDDESSRVSAVAEGTVGLAQYDYLGVGSVVRTKLNEIACMSRVFDDSAPPLYVDLDRFNRITTSRWTKDLTTDRDFYQVALTYDRDSNITSTLDGVHGAYHGITAGYDVAYSMDNVNRLTEAQEGTLVSGSISAPTRDEHWTLGHTGNWDVETLDLNGNGVLTDAGDLNDHRTHNAVNELLARDTDNDGSPNYSPAYDAAGNMTDDAQDYKYVYDAWNRLRQVTKQDNSPIAEYRYNGLNHRIGVHEDREPDGDVDVNDAWYYDVFDERWRQLARYSGSESTPREDFVPHQAGASGHGGSSYIDLVICRNKDTDVNGSLEERTYFCQNWRADVSALVKLVGSAGTELREWVKYSAYGTPIGLPGGDTDSDGDCDLTDFAQVQTWISASTYDVRGDIDLDGDVDATDKGTIRNNYVSITLGRGALSASNVVNRKGYAGYEALSGLAGGKWLARNRVLAADVGRWNRRDILGYVDGLNLYQTHRGDPMLYMDAFGTSCNMPGPGAGGGAATAGSSALPTSVRTIGGILTSGFGGSPPMSEPGPGVTAYENCCRKGHQNYPLSGGKVVCCQGERVPCDFTKYSDGMPPPTSAAGVTIYGCVLQHEKTHLDKGHAGGQTTCPYADPPGSLDGIDAGWASTYSSPSDQEDAETEAFQAEYDCLDKGEGQCHSKACKRCVEARKGQAAADSPHKLKDKNGQEVPNWPFAGSQAACVADVKRVPMSRAFRCEPLARGPEAKTVEVMVSARSHASFCANGRAHDCGWTRYAHTSVHVINAMQRDA